MSELIIKLPLINFEKKFTKSDGVAIYLHGAMGPTSSSTSRYQYRATASHSPMAY